MPERRNPTRVVPRRISAHRDNVMARTLPKPPWKTANPKTKTGRSRKLTSTQKSKARKAAKKAGRRYPNLVDNMRVTAEARRKSQ